MVALLEVFDVYEDDVFGRVRDGCRHRENDRERAEKANRGEDWVTPVTELFRLEGFQEP